jgi:hypothetical protein
MYQPSMPQLHLVAAADVAGRRATADRDRQVKLALVERRPKIVHLFDRPILGRVIRFPDRTPPAPEAA